MTDKLDPQDPHNELAHRVIASLNRAQVDFLDKIGKDAQFSSGTKLTRTQIIACMVNVLRRLQLSGSGIKSTEEFESYLVNKILNGQSRQASSQSPKKKGAH